jgi:hypothetical protein
MRQRLGEWRPCDRTIDQPLHPSRLKICFTWLPAVTLAEKMVDKVGWVTRRRIGDVLERLGLYENR